MEAGIAPTTIMAFSATNSRVAQQVRRGCSRLQVGSPCDLSISWSCFDGISWAHDRLEPRDEHPEEWPAGRRWAGRSCSMRCDVHLGPANTPLAPRQTSGQQSGLLPTRFRMSTPLGRGGRRHDPCPQCFPRKNIFCFFLPCALLADHQEKGADL